MGYKLKRILIYPDGVTEKQVYPAGWKPNANTIAYYPLTSTTTVNNQISGGTNLTNSSCTFGTNHGIDCVSISGNADATHYGSIYLYANISGLPTGANPRTFSFWCYNDNASITNVDECYIFQGQGSTNKMVFVYSGLDASGNYCISNRGQSSPTYNVSRKQRCNHIISYDGSKFSWYLNGTEIISWTYTINTGSNKFSLGGASENIYWNGFNGSFSELIIENKAWTAQEVANYYNTTKSNYGL